MVRKRELEHLRESNSKTYLLSDGSFQYISFSEDCHYLRDGKFYDINNDIKKSEDNNFVFSNSENSWEVYFKKDISENEAIKIKNGKDCICFSVLNGNKTSVQRSVELNRKENWYYNQLKDDNRSVVYEKVFENIDIVYTVLAGSLKESIVVHNSSIEEICLKYFVIN